MEMGQKRSVGFTDDNARGRDAFVDFGFYEAVEVVAGSVDAGLILGLGEVVEGYLVR